MGIWKTKQPGECFRFGEKKNWTSCFSPISFSYCNPPTFPPLLIKNIIPAYAYGTHPGHPRPLKCWHWTPAPGAPGLSGTKQQTGFRKTSHVYLYLICLSISDIRVILGSFQNEDMKKKNALSGRTITPPPMIRDMFPKDFDVLPKG